jgi:hypothetical protein
MLGLGRIAGLKWETKVGKALNTSLRQHKQEASQQGRVGRERFWDEKFGTLRILRIFSFTGSQMESNSVKFLTI